ncbi:MAG: tRNA lysidine(34) synthetase TilS [Symploca sp. SIO2B6]|nr:tRNA lysidine(34) synthetase TilS [Symploca sp. SIO2B6]
MARLWTPLHAKFHQVLRSRHLAFKGQRILVAVSGGQDSLCLMQLLLDLQPKWQWDLAIAHCNHGWRSDANANADYVQALAHQWNIPYFEHKYGHQYDHGDVQNHERISPMPVPPESITTEAGARAWRYRMLTTTAIAHRYDLLMTGHTASDRAETLLYNLMRGSGADGLQALTWQRSLQGEDSSVKLVRPLLFMARSETGAFCQSQNLTPWFDTTNDDWRYARNRIRQDLLPYLQEHFNPRVEQTLAQTAEILQADVAYLEHATEELWNAAVVSMDEPETKEPEMDRLKMKGSGMKEPEKQGEQGAQSNIPRGVKQSYAPETIQPTSSRTAAQRVTQNPTIVLDRPMLASAPLALQRRVMRRCLLTLLPKAPNFDQIEKLTVLITAPNRSQTDPFPGGAIARVDGRFMIVGNDV